MACDSALTAILILRTIPPNINREWNRGSRGNLDRGERRVMQDGRPSISLVLPTLNALPHVQRTVEALRLQTCQDFELIVQDGGSTDGTVEYMRSLSGFRCTDVESARDFGIGQAYNRG